MWQTVCINSSAVSSQFTNTESSDTLFNGNELAFTCSQISSWTLSSQLKYLSFSIDLDVGMRTVCSKMQWDCMHEHRLFSIFSFSWVLWQLLTELCPERCKRSLSETTLSFNTYIFWEDKMGKKICMKARDSSK